MHRRRLGGGVHDPGRHLLPVWKRRDNAIEAERGLDASDKRSISLNVRRSADLALIHVENYFSGTLAFKDGLPKTTKSDVANHGFGTKSMQLIAQRYGGTLTTRTQGEVFCLDVMLPIPE